MGLQMTTKPASDDDDLFGVCRENGDVLVRWSELTDREQRAAWEFHVKMFGGEMPEVG